MCQAAATGAVDYARADPRDRLWWARLAIVTAQIADRNRDEIARLDHANAVATLAIGLTEKGMEQAFARAAKVIDDVFRRRFPWVLEAESAKAAAVTRGVNAWTATWGDPASPETAAAIDATVAAMVEDAAKSRRMARWA